MHYNYVYWLSINQVASRHVSKILAINMERIKSKNPELKNRLV